MSQLLRLFFTALLSALLVSCGGGSSPAAAPPLADGSAKVRAGIATHVLSPLRAPRSALAAAGFVDATNLMDWAEQAYPQYFPSHRDNLSFPPYVYRFYPETGAYLGVDGQWVRVMGPQFGPDILTVGVLTDFVCNVFPENCAPPTASAGVAQQVLVGSTVTLHGTGTDANGLPLAYTWSLTDKPVGSAAALTATNIANPTFMADLPGTYQASLVVSNGTQTSIAAFVLITATAANVAPVADAGGSRNVVVGSAVFLSGAGSLDGNGDPLTYQWTLIKPTGSSAYLSAASTVSPYFTPDVAGIYVATLVVNDGKVNSAAANVNITATSASTYCCKRCTTGKPCGNTCISWSYTCRTSGGCAC